MTVHIIGGGTFAHVRAHLALAAPAFGGTARFIASQYRGMTVADLHGIKNLGMRMEAKLHLTKMADPDSKLVTNDDVAALVDQLIADPDCRVIYFNTAMTDFDGAIVDPDVRIDDGDPITVTPSGKYAERLKTREGNQMMLLTPAEKIISRIRRERKDIFLIAFKTTAGATSDEQYLAGLNLLKANSCNLVLANDIVTRNNMIIAPEETRYHETTDRGHAMTKLVEMVKARSTNTFTRSTVVDGDLVDFQNDARVPDNLRKVVNHLVENSAYKSFRDKTVGHFATRISDKACLTSRRKVNFNDPHGLDLVEVEYEGTDKVIAHGAKPSVGGQSQRVIFTNHPDVDCIAHAHVEMRTDARDRDKISIDDGQWKRECGSTECGTSVSDHLPDGEIRAVMISGHGPNICFNRNTPAEKVIDFIDANFDLSSKTGGLV